MAEKKFTMTEIKLNRKTMKDKIYGCWLGKNIGGTMGAPFEGTKEFLDIPGYTTPRGEPLPNDDLDLQLIWLIAMENVGPYNLDANELGYYWLRYIPAAWNEYAIGKANMRAGLLPPLSGEMNNGEWKNSNGAWIRSEIWACLCPGVPSAAIRYAIADACIDHGVSEGTVAEMFTAALESLAFFESDIRAVIEKALTYIPENSRVAKDVKFVIDEYDKKTPYREVRDSIVKRNEDLGWFQAPANVAYVIIGLLYGEGDFEKSLIYSINCGDDTDCTGATCGAVLGIMLGAKGVPTKLSEYIGDRIITLSLDLCATKHREPTTCTELTERVMRLMPTVLFANGIYMEYTDGQTEADLSEYGKDNFFTRSIPKDKTDISFMEKSPYSFNIKESFLKATVEYEKAPQISPLESIKAKVTFKNLGVYDARWLNIDVILPEGFSASYKSAHYCHHLNSRNPVDTYWDIEITAGEKVDAKNKIYIIASSENHPRPLIIPMVILG